ncbi:MAG: hypothetical protein A3I66_20245 [Burkholderiales bacterium RIFCSPLOWO2_02_FULL_57_36]|nr:MAG: hypothetical protein A3I66_20245 [Burkholderiales bacterium RIFCSPLOWO2_02_FULL_57_36]
MVSPKSHVIELNEFSLPLLKQAAHELNLSNIKRILAFSHGTTMADQKIEHQGLDPWVQWVSIHAEIPSQVHGIIRLGDVPKLKHEQIWERLAKKGITTGVWGIMNGSRKNAPSNTFFFADPWTFSETPFPSKLNDFLALPIYYAKNYLSLSISKLLRSTFQTFKFILQQVPISTLAADAWFLLRNAAGTKIDSCFLFAAFELVSVRLFVKYRNLHKPDVTFLFLNSIAHFQHHEWKNNVLDRKTAFLFRSIDRMLSTVLPPEASQDRILILNGLTQKNVENDSLYCYRQIDPANFLKALGLRFSKVEQCMTSDGHVFFDNPADCLTAAEFLKHGTVNGEAAFDVEIDNINNCKLFYQVAYWGEANTSTNLCFNGLELPFLSQFSVHAKRTGAHSDEGDYFVQGAALPPKVENAKILSYLWPA